MTKDNNNLEKNKNFISDDKLNISGGTLTNMRFKGMFKDIDFGKEVEVSCFRCGQKYKILSGSVGYSCPKCKYCPSCGPHQQDWAGEITDEWKAFNEKEFTK